MNIAITIPGPTTRLGEAGRKASEGTTLDIQKRPTPLTAVIFRGCKNSVMRSFLEFGIPVTAHGIAIYQ